MKQTFGVALVLLGLGSSLLAQDMAEAARRERERRKKAQDAGQAAAVVTDDELKANKGALANDPGAPAPAASPAKASGSAPSQSPQQSQEQWHARAQAMRGDIEAWQKRYDYWSSLHLAPGQYFVDDDGRKLVGSPENLQKLVARAKVRLDTAKKALEDLEDAARKQNVPPGWLR